MFFNSLNSHMVRMRKKEKKKGSARRGGGGGLAQKGDLLLLGISTFLGDNDLKRKLKGRMNERPGEGTFSC